MELLAKNSYQYETENRFAALMADDASTERDRNEFKDVVVQEAQKMLDKRPSRKNNPWFTEDIPEVRRDG